MTALTTQSPRPLTAFHPNLPPLLVDLTTRLLSRDPLGRPPRATDIASAIAIVEEDLAHPPPPARPKPSNRRYLYAAGVALLTGLAVVVAWFALRSRPSATVPAAALAAPVDGALAPHQVTVRVGERVTVEFTVDKIEKAADGMTHVYANDPQLKGEQFRLILRDELMRAMDDRGLLRPDTAVGHTVRAHGMITREGTVAEMLIQEPTQFDRLPPRGPITETPLAAAKPSRPVRPGGHGNPKTSDDIPLPPDHDSAPFKSDASDEDLAKALEDLAKLLRVVPGGKKR